MKNNYGAKFVRAIDGDTVELDIDVGFHITVRDHFRLLGIDCPEKTGPTKAAGLAAKAFTEKWFADRERDSAHEEIEFRTYKVRKPRKQDVYGRYLVDVRPADSEDPTLSEALLAAGHAVEDDG